MMKVFGFSYGTGRGLVRYTDDGQVRFFLMPGKSPGGASHEMKPDEMMRALSTAVPIDSGYDLSADEVRALQGAVEVLVKDLTVPKDPRRRGV